MISIAVRLQNDQKHLREEKIYLAHPSILQSIFEGSQSSNSWQSLNAAYRLPPRDLLILLSYISQDNLLMSGSAHSHLPSHVGH